MAYIVQEKDIEPTTPSLLSVGATEVTLSATRLGRSRRSFFSIIPLTPGMSVTISYGEQTAVLNAGIPLIQNQPLFASLTGTNPAMPCEGVYQGEIKAIANIAGTVAFVEVFDA